MGSLVAWRRLPITRFAYLYLVTDRAPEKWEHCGAMEQPKASDFDVKVSTGGVNVTFRPTLSYYWFDRLIRPHNMIERLGPISSSATVSI